MVLSPSAEGFRANIISLISFFFIFSVNFVKFISCGPIPSIGDKRLPKTKTDL